MLPSRASPDSITNFLSTILHNAYYATKCFEASTGAARALSILDFLLSMSKYSNDFKILGHESVAIQIFGKITKPTSNKVTNYSNSKNAFTTLKTKASNLKKFFQNFYTKPKK